MGAIGLLPILVILFLVWLTIRRARAERAFRAAAVHAEAEITDIDWKVVGPLPDRDRLAVPSCASRSRTGA